MNFSNKLKIEDLRTWCKESAELKNVKLHFSETSEDKSGRRVQVLCNNWPASGKPFASLDLWPEGCRIRAYDESKPVRKHKKLPF